MTTGATIHTTEGLKMTVTRRTKPPVIPNLGMKVISDLQESIRSTPSMVVSAATVASGEDQRELSWFSSFKLPRHTEWVCSLRSPQSYNLVTYFSKLFWFSMCICSHFLMFLPFFGIFLLKYYLRISIYICSGNIWLVTTFGCASSTTQRRSFLACYFYKDKISNSSWLISADSTAHTCRL